MFIDSDLCAKALGLGSATEIRTKDAAYSKDDEFIFDEKLEMHGGDKRWRILR